MDRLRKMRAQAAEAARQAKEAAHAKARQAAEAARRVKEEGSARLSHARSARSDSMDSVQSRYVGGREAVSSPRSVYNWVSDKTADASAAATSTFGSLKARAQQKAEALRKVAGEKRDAAKAAYASNKQVLRSTASDALNMVKSDLYTTVQDKVHGGPVDPEGAHLRVQIAWAPVLPLTDADRSYLRAVATHLANATAENSEIFGMFPPGPKTLVLHAIPLHRRSASKEERERDEAAIGDAWKSAQRHLASKVRRTDVILEKKHSPAVSSMESSIMGQPRAMAAALAVHLRDAENQHIRSVLGYAADKAAAFVMAKPRLDMPAERGIVYLPRAHPVIADFIEKEIEYRQASLLKSRETKRAIAVDHEEKVAEEVAAGVVDDSASDKALSSVVEAGAYGEVPLASLFGKRASNDLFNFS